MKLNSHIRRLTLTGVFVALTAVATLIIRIPTITKGYINLGDTVVNLAGWVLGPFNGAAAAGLGSALADLISGYTVYVPATFIIKALMAAAAFQLWALLAKRLKDLPARIIAAVAAELIMIAGYAVFEGLLYGSFASAVASLSGNLVQGIFGAAASVTLYEAVLKRIPHLTDRN
ncbi:MAG: ECF transporter S component [Oscillospiraceae bacterium]|nr:ECF transporter S component [Oscillospiraceae bacterium]